MSLSEAIKNNAILGVPKWTPGNGGLITPAGQTITFGSGTAIPGLPGAQGAQGIQGAAGVAGAKGSDGAAGVAGAKGSDGAAGTAGASGVNGTQGIPGIQGATGAAGLGTSNTAEIVQLATSILNTQTLIVATAA